ncbi:MAG: hypothetical protein LBC67_01930 [Spirochaetales bacterium]|jgi:hypothetical protein|nr:hypothetical protein [Spirochaetales bacterium]
MRKLQFNKKIFGLGLGAGAVFTILVVLAVIMVYRPAPVSRELPSLRPETPLLEISAFDFLLPDERERFLAPRPWYFRAVGRGFSPEEVKGFWVDPRGLAVEFLARGNRKKLDDIFNRVP